MTKTTLRDILNLVFRHITIVVLFAIVVVAAAAIYYFEAARIYKSTAKIMVSVGAETLGRGGSLNDHNVLFTQRAEQLHNEQEILKSVAVLSTVSRWIVAGGTDCPCGGEMADRVVELRRYLSGEVPQPTLFLRAYDQVMKAYDYLFGHTPNEQEKIAGMAQALYAGLDVKPIFDSDTLEISFKYRNPTVAQTFLRLVIAAYVQHHIDVFQNNDELSLMKTQMDDSSGHYKTSLAEFSDFMGKHKMYNDASQADLLMQQRDKLSQELTDALAVRDETATRAASLAAIKASLREYERFTTVEVRNRERETLNKELDDAEISARALLSKHPESSRAYQDQQAQVSMIRGLLEKEPAQVVDQTEQRKSKAYETVETDLISLNAQLQGNDARVALLKNELGRTQADLQSYAADLQTFNMLKMAVETAKHESEEFSQGYLQNKIRLLTAQSAITNVSTIDPPTWDPVFTSPNKKMILAATLLLLIVGSMAMVVIAHYLDTTISDPQSVARDVEAPIAAVLPFSTVQDKATRPVEAFLSSNKRELARLYQTVEAHPSAKVILLAKSRKGEGSSLVGLVFATFLSRYTGRRTAFLDCTATQMEQQPTDGLHIETYSASEREDDSDRTAKLARLREQYDYVVIAAEPVRDSTDLIQLSSSVDVTVFLIEAEKTRREAARYNLDLLRKFGFQDIHLLLNKRRFHIPNWIVRFV